MIFPLLTRIIRLSRCALSFVSRISPPDALFAQQPYISRGHTTHPRTTVEIACIPVNTGKCGREDSREMCAVGVCPAHVQAQDFQVSDLGIHLVCLHVRDQSLHALNRFWHKPMSIEVTPRTRTARTLRDIHHVPVRQHSVCLWSMHGLYDDLAEPSAHMQFLAVGTSSAAISDLLKSPNCNAKNPRHLRPLPTAATLSTHQESHLAKPIPFDSTGTNATTDRQASYGHASFHKLCKNCPGRQNCLWRAYFSDDL